MVEQVVSVFSPYLVVFEDLKPGDRIWRVTEHDGLLLRLAALLDAGRVEGRETLELAAGSFDTIKVTIDQNIQRRRAYGPRWEHLDAHPDDLVFAAGKARSQGHEPRVSRPVRTPFFATYDLELVSYQLQ